MPPENRVPSSPTGSSRGAASPPFCRVERCDADGKTRHFVVHTKAPKFVVEFDRSSSEPAGTETAASDQATARARRRPVIRRVCVPNSWAGDYHLCARQLGAAADFFAATETPEA